MPAPLQAELRQTRPFSSPEAEAVLGVLRTAALLERDVAEALRPHGLTLTQYNVLRILRGAGPVGLCRYEVADRLLTPGPDVTRLLDRLEDEGLTSRARNPEDRRQVRAQITSRGLAVLAELDGVFDALHRTQLGHLGADRLQALSGLLAAVRDR